jgi:hypothetical protein
MPDIDVQPDALRDADTGEPILTREAAEQARLEWTEQHPPVPGLRWVISFSLDGQIRDRHLEVIPGWEDAYAPPRRAAPPRAGAGIDQDEANRLGALAYQGWFSALPAVVRDGDGKQWNELPEPFKQPLRQAGVIVWQHGENAGFHQALLRTLPAGQLGAAGELENMRDLIYAQAITDTLSAPGQKPTPPNQITVNLKWLREELTARVEELRRQAAEAVKREKDAGRQR